MFCGADATSRDADVVATSVLHGYWDLNLFHHLLLLHTSLRDDLGHVHHFLLHEPEPAGTHSLSPSLSLSLFHTLSRAFTRFFSWMPLPSLRRASDDLPTGRMDMSI